MCSYSFFLVDYYTDKFKYEIRFPYSPVIECVMNIGQPHKKILRASAHYPLEVLWLCDNQRVRQQTPELIQSIIKKCAVIPTSNYAHAMISRKAWGFENSEICKEASIGVTKTPMTVCYFICFFLYMLIVFGSRV